MTNKVTKYGVMIIAAVLLVAIAFAGAAGAKEIVVDDWNTQISNNTNGSILVIGATPEEGDVIKVTGDSAYMISPKYNDGDSRAVGEPVALVFPVSVTLDFSEYKGGFEGYDGDKDAVAALFGYIKIAHEKTLTIKGLTMTGVTVRSSVDYYDVAGVIGYVEEENYHYPDGDISLEFIDCHLQDCLIEATIDGDDDDCGEVGGLVGAADAVVTFTDCTVMNCDITGSSYGIGGLIGDAYHDMFITNCAVQNCNIISTGDCGVGALAGEADDGTAIIMDCTVEYCNLSSYYDESGCSDVGGLVGGFWADNSTVVNCTVKYCDITGSDYGVGGLFGETCTDGDSEHCVSVSDCTAAYCNITGTTNDGYGVGGIIGYLDDNTLIENCAVLNCNVSSVKYGVGGLVGYTDDGGFYFIIRDCMAVDCSITGAGDDNEEVGGLVGAADIVVTFTDCTVMNCDITGSSYGIGGLIGDAYDGMFITNCAVQNCNIISTGDCGVGALAGEADDGTAIIMDCTVEYCNLSSYYDESGCSDVGGLVGGFWADNSTVVNCTVKYCDITGSDYGVGGLFGETCTDGDSEHCVSVSDCTAAYCNITGTTNDGYGVGGIIGYLYDNTLIENCAVLNCNMSSVSNGVGGLVGYTYGRGSYFIIRDCMAVDCSVTGISDESTEVGGIIGYIDEDITAVDITNCYVSGSVAGSCNVGGLAGYLGETTKISDCIALNELILSDDEPYGRVGGYIGSGAVISNCYAWNGMLVNGASVSGGAADNKDGADASSFDFWNNQSYFQTVLGWDFADVWQMNSGNKRCCLPVLKWQTTPVAGDVSYLIPYSISPANENNVSIFGNINYTAVRSGAVTSVLLNSIHNVTGVSVFVTDNPSLQTLPDSSYSTHVVISIFNIDASNDGSGTPSTINVTVTLADPDDEDKVVFWHFNTTLNDWDSEPLTSTIISGSGTGTVTYLVETDSFSPFGVGIYTPIPQPQPKSSSSRNDGTSIWLTATPTPVPTDAAPAAQPTQAVPVASPVKSQPTQTSSSPAPFVGILAGLGAAAVFFGMRRK